jgi:VWFA-related protein
VTALRSASLALAVLAPVQQPAVFPAKIELVNVVVSVTNQNGDPVRDLVAKDFVVSEDGKRRPIEAFLRTSDIGDSERAPVDMVLLLDTSPSMDTDLARAHDVLVDFVKALPSPRGRDVVAFDERVRTWAFDKDDIGTVLDDILLARSHQWTRFFDAVIEGLKRVSVGPGRKAMVAFTDGEDTSSLKTRSDVRNALQEAEVTFYAVSYAPHLDVAGAPSPLAGAGPQAFETQTRSERAAFVLRDFASATGGLVLDGSAGDLVSRFTRIRNDIAAQYVIGFIPAPSSKPAHRRLKVDVMRKGLKVRHREGYETRPQS